jgi:hypothetical protein
MKRENNQPIVLMLLLSNLTAEYSVIGKKPELPQNFSYQRSLERSEIYWNHLIFPNASLAQ